MSFNPKLWLASLGGDRGRLAKDPRVVMRVILGVLLLANLVAALVLVRPWGQSPEQLEAELSRLHGELRSRKASVEQMRSNLDKVEGAREDGDRFMQKYFLNRHVASSTMLVAIRSAASDAGLKPGALNFQEEPIEGSSNLAIATITGNYEGNYTNLVRFLNAVDRSPHFLILDTLTAAPERNAGTLNVNLRIHAFVVYGAGEPLAPPAPVEEGGVPAEVSQAGAQSTEARLAR